MNDIFTNNVKSICEQTQKFNQFSESPYKNVLIKIQNILTGEDINSEFYIYSIGISFKIKENYFFVIFFVKNEFIKISKDFCTKRFTRYRKQKRNKYIQ